MATVKPFKAVRPTRDKVALVSSKSYDLYSSDELQSKLDYNPYSFLHVVNPGYKYHQQDITGEQRFKLVHNRYLEFKEDDVFTQDEEASFYIYETIMPKTSFCGIIAATSVEDYHNNVIKKHEDTLRQREVLFEDYLKNTGFNAEPVLLTYPDNATIERIIQKYKDQRPEYEFSTTDKNTHRLWIVNEENDIKAIEEAFKAISTLYIADGHHRSTSSCYLAQNLAKDNPEHTGQEDYNYFMSYFLPESQLSIYEFNRFIKDLNGFTVDDFLIELDTYYKIEKKGLELYKPSQKHQFSMYLDGDFYALTLRRSGYEFTTELSYLDSEILYQTVLKPILGIEDVRNASKIVYSQDKSGGLELKTKVDAGSFKVSFGMLPVTMTDIKSIVNANLLMPPKTTYIEPKMRSAITIYEFLV